MRNERMAFGISERGGSRALFAATALLAGLSACGDNIQVDTAVPVPPFSEQVTCNVKRTECNGFAATSAALGLGGLDVNCAPGMLTSQPTVFQATACFVTTPPADGGTEQTTQEQNDAKAACAHYCDPGFGATSTYPIGDSLTQQNSGVTCESDADLTTIQKGVNGQCSLEQVDGGDPGKTVFVNCHIGGRACNGAQTAPDGTQYCAGTPLVANQETSTCYNPTTMTAEVACENSWKWPMMPPGAANDQDWFHWVFVSAPIQEPNEQDCQVVATQSIAFTGLGIASGSLGSFTFGGAPMALTAKAGFMTIGETCDEFEHCFTVIGKMKLELQDLTLAGLTFHNPEATLITPVKADTFSNTIAAGTMKLDIEGDITSVGRARTVVTVPQALTLSTTATTASLNGSVSTTVPTSAKGWASVSGSISITGSTTSSNAACANETPLQQLLGFETTADWRSTQAPLALTSSHTQGCFGLQVGGNGYRTLNSTFFATPLPGTTQTLAVDVFVPPNPPNPQWLGAVQLYLSCPSANFFNQYIGEDELTGLPLGKFSTLSYPIPAPIKSMLQGSHSGCFFSVAVNANQTPTPPVLDNLRFK